MYYKEHQPAHFHAEHQGQHGKFDFAGRQTIGDIQSRTAPRLIEEWAGAHQGELEANWVKMKAGQPLDRIAPLEQHRAMIMPLVIRADYTGGFHIHLTFTDGSDGVVDFEPWLDRDVFEPLKDVAYFRRSFLEGGTVVWPNGADVAPETLHDAVLAARADKRLEPSRR